MGILTSIAPVAAPKQITSVTAVLIVSPFVVLKVTIALSELLPQTLLPVNDNVMLPATNSLCVGVYTVVCPLLGLKLPSPPVQFRLHSGVEDPWIEIELLGAQKAKSGPALTTGVGITS